MPVLGADTVANKERHTISTESVGFRYGSAFISVLFATAVRLALTPLLHDRVPFIIYFPAIVFTAWAGGLGPGLLATLLSTFAAAFLFFLPFLSLQVSNRLEIWSLGIFVLSSCAISYIGEAQRKAQYRAEAQAEAAREARRRNDRILESITDLFMLYFPVTHVAQTACEGGRHSFCLL